MTFAPSKDWTRFERECLTVLSSKLECAARCRALIPIVLKHDWPRREAKRQLKRRIARAGTTWLIRELDELEAAVVSRICTRKLARGIFHWDRTLPLRPYFSRIVSNAASDELIDWTRTRARERNLPDEGQLAASDGLKLDRQLDLLAAIDELSLSDRRLIQRLFLVGHTVEAVAADLFVCARTVKRRRDHALEKLRRILEA